MTWAYFEDGDFNKLLRLSGLDAQQLRWHQHRLQMRMFNKKLLKARRQWGY
jgi:hypothetical protein